LVALVEAILDGAAMRHTETVISLGTRPQAIRALLICACVTLEYAPTWLIYEGSDGTVKWTRIPDGSKAADVVDGRVETGGHADPTDVLAWLKGEAPDPWANGHGGGDQSVVPDLQRRIQHS
jgi:hypothetical protein